MNPYSEDHPDLTRFALDELPTAESEAVKEALTHAPSLQAEVAAIQNIAHQLKAQAPLHDLRLTGAQRQRVLQGPITKPTAPRPRAQQLKPRTRSGPWHFVRSLTRIAAAVALLLSAFWLGFTSKETKSNTASAAKNLSNQDPEIATVVIPDPVSTARKDPADPLVGRDLIAQAPAAPPPPENASADSIALTQTEPTLTPPSRTAPQSDQPVATSDRTPAKAPTLVASSLGITEPTESTDFVNASRRSSDSLPLRPKNIRPQATSAASGKLQAKPLSPSDRNTPSVSPSRAKPTLFVHAWRSEVASCPWNSAHRLLRITIQLPSDQEAAQIGDHTYPLDITFDPNNVREFRRLCSRSYPSPEADQAGKLAVWYEFQPNGTAAETHGNGKHIANVRLAAARFTTQAVGPFDASQVQVLDRGQSWQEAREDFVFESAQVGLQLLLDGTAQTGHLNHRLVLELAEHSQASESDSSRGYFVKTLRELQKLTGRN